jgi:hypothetical protein
MDGLLDASSSPWAVRLFSLGPFILLAFRLNLAH